MSSEVAQELFEACETGKGNEGCSKYLVDGATFSCQSDALKDMKTVADYCDWMKGACEKMPDCSCKVIAKGESGNKVMFYAQFFMSPSAPPSDYVYVMDMNDEGKCSGMVKIWNSTWAFGSH